MAFYSLLSAIPAFLLFVGYIVALAFAVVRRQQLGPRPATLLITGLAVLLFLDVIEVAWPFAFSRLYDDFSGTRMGITTVIGTIGLVTGLIHLVGVVLIVLAVFAGRGFWPARPAYPPGAPTWPAAGPPAAPPSYPSTGSPPVPPA